MHLSPAVSFVRMFYNETEPNIDPDGGDSEYQARMILSSKSFRWLYEREWRMFAPQGKNRYHDVATVTCVYLGSRISDDDRTTIIHRLAPLNINTQSMTIKKYSMRFEERRSALFLKCPVLEAAYQPRD